MFVVFFKTDKMVNRWPYCWHGNELIALNQDILPAGSPAKLAVSSCCRVSNKAIFC